MSSNRNRVFSDILYGFYQDQTKSTIDQLIAEVIEIEEHKNELTTSDYQGLLEGLVNKYSKYLVYENK